MTSYAERLKAEIEADDFVVKKGGGNFAPKVGEGIFTCLATEASCGKGESGNQRGMIAFKVLSGGKDEEVGGQFRIYIQTINEDFCKAEIKLWAQMLRQLGVPDSKIYDEDAENQVDVVNNIMSIANKLASKGKLKLVIQRKLQGKPDKEGRPRYWNNIQSVVLPEHEAVEAEAPKKATKLPAKAKKLNLDDDDDLV